MFAIDRTRAALIGLRADIIILPGVTVAWVDAARNLWRALSLVVAAASLAACAQTSMVRQSSIASGTSSLAPSRQAGYEHHRSIMYASHDHPTVATRPPFVPDHKEARSASQGLASFYSEGQQTANGEQFDPNELTAAHPSLPFGTHLRVTNMSTGRSVTVRVNDRGPFVHGRVVDVSYSAARALGMVHAGVANVKLDVVQ
jgi:rare lipoprotein A